MLALERNDLAIQPNFVNRVTAIVIEVAREIQLEPSPNYRRFDLSFQVLRGNNLGPVFAKVIAGQKHPYPEGEEVTYMSNDAHLKTAISEVWDFIAGSNQPTQTP